MTAAKAYVAEFVGTFILTFTVGCNVLSGQTIGAGASIGCSLMVAIYALAPISGANFNPAVSVSLGIVGKLPWKDVALYSVVQVLAGMLAGLLSDILYGAALALGPVGDFSWWQAGICELLYTFMLCFVVLNTACSAANAGKRQFYALSIGFMIVAGAYGAGAVSGGCFNPAVALGLQAGSLSRASFDSLSSFLGWSPLYVAFELAGAVVAAGCFQAVRPPRFEEGRPARMLAKVTSEILGTYMLVLTVGLNCLAEAIGARDAVIYWGAQVIGGILAAGTYMGIYAGETLGFGDGFGPGKGFGLWWEVAVAEAFFTSVLAFVVVSVACSPSARRGSYSEVFGLNPAVSIGIAASQAMGGSGFGGFLREGWVYTLSEMAGAGAAALVYFLTHADRSEESEESDDEERERLNPSDDEEEQSLMGSWCSR
ncbi:unnamed protein product [Prorocentrum cordatum]|uniref:Aquaporin n=1 Tax=Prorocentrum cordatum TaxID=2364126 RepID=A0ABN9Y3S3_9DINO|nr:unnamed protein product [Polarella glacialis]